MRLPSVISWATLRASIDLALYRATHCAGLSSAITLSILRLSAAARNYSELAMRILCRSRESPVLFARLCWPAEARSSRTSRTPTCFGCVRTTAFASPKRILFRSLAFSSRWESLCRHLSPESGAENRIKMPRLAFHLNGRNGSTGGGRPPLSSRAATEASRIVS